jgi:hypothetical protein
LARLGDLDLFDNNDGAKPSTVSLANAKIHENYSPTRYNNDIAILTLQESVNNPTVWPICLPTVNPYRSMSYLNFSPTLAGWGSVSFRKYKKKIQINQLIKHLNNTLTRHLLPTNRFF